MPRHPISGSGFEPRPQSEEFDLRGLADSKRTRFQLIDFYVAGSLAVEVDGRKQVLGTDYTEDADLNHFTFTAAPASGSRVLVRYRG